MSEEPKPAHGVDADALEDADTQAAPFDVEATDGEATPRRRRPVADWGGDDLFDYVPRRRFRSGAHPRRAGSVPAPAHTTRRSSDLFELPPARPVAHRGDVELNAAHIRSSYMPKRTPVAEEIVVETLTAEDVLPPAPRRERSGLPMSQRLGPRPDRIAAWAFMLGLLLILLAVGTADASGF